MTLFRSFALRTVCSAETPPFLFTKFSGKTHLRSLEAKKLKRRQAEAIMKREIVIKALLKASEDPLELLELLKKHVCRLLSSPSLNS